VEGDEAQVRARIALEIERALQLAGVASQDREAGKNG
jgi:hypothetical protein